MGDYFIMEIYTEKDENFSASQRDDVLIMGFCVFFTQRDNNVSEVEISKLN